MGFGNKKRSLIITHAPLKQESGAGQVAINLAEALRNLNYEVVIWSAAEVVTKGSSLNRFFQIRDAINRFILNQPAFDIIDTPPWLVTSFVRNRTQHLVVRHVCPEIMYSWSEVIEFSSNSLKGFLRAPFYLISFLVKVFFTLLGWSRADHILCLGSHDYHGMQRYFPWWQKKMKLHFNQLSTQENKFLSIIRQKRSIHDRDKKGINFLWIGRWCKHKGKNTLRRFIAERMISNPEDSFTLAGCGDIEKVKEELSKEMIGSGRVNLIASYSRDFLNDLLLGHDVGLFISETEGWGLSLQEMLESGMPVYVTNAGGVPDLKPFIQEGLFQFPPPEHLSMNSLPKVVINPEYFNQFNWLKVAQIYQEFDCS